MIIIGSTAINYWIPSFREPKDLDVFSSKKEDGVDTITIPEEIMDQFKAGEDYFTDCGDGEDYATLDVVYTIKCSHLGWDIKWEKHKKDALFLKGLGCELLPNLYETLVKYWRVENGNKEFLSMYKKKSDFFNDHVPYVYDHDYLHELVAFPNKPVYTHCLVDGEDVAIDYIKFKQLSLEQQKRMFKEEISVIAAERWLIPPKICGKYTWMQAYRLALHKTVTQLTKNWATDFLIEHLEYFNKPDYSYFQHLFNTIEEGEIIMGKRVENAEEIRDEIIQAYNETDPDWPLEEGSWYDFEELGDFNDFGIIEQEGGGEGGAEDCTLVFMWKDKYYRLNYSYYSYHGYDFDDAMLYEVTPVEKVVTVYE